MKAEEPWSWLVGVLVILWVGQTVFVLVLGRHFHASRILEASKWTQPALGKPSSTVADQSEVSAKLG